MMEVLYSTGIRRMECVNLTRTDLHPDRGVLAVRQGKGKKDRFVPISDRAVTWLRRYIDTVRIHQALSPDPEHLFLESTGQPISADKLSRIVARYIKEADIGKGGSCHLFRHTVATLMLDNGADIRFIQQMLGHVSIGITESYTHVSIVKLKQVHEMTHPTQQGKSQSDVTQSEPEATEEALLDTLAEEAAGDIEGNINIPNDGI